jgi:ribonuclease HII
MAGVDEAGRGPLAGPVTVAAVILPGNELDWDGVALNDSKKLSEKQRQVLETVICAQAVAYAVVHVSVADIDRLNILGATLQGMRDAVLQLRCQPQQVLVDGNKVPDVPMPAQAVIGGDGKIAAISAASILAKNARDRLMCELHAQYPCYGFDRHKGYGTREHLARLAEHGPCPAHRRSFAPVRRFFQADLFA